jgi:hydrogenase maturation protease
MRDPLPENRRPALVTQVRIVGIGSWSGDDRIGWNAIEAIEASGFAARYPEGTVQTWRCERLGELPRLADGACALILVDALRSGAPAGTVRRLDASALAASQERASSHGLGVAEWLALCRALELLPPVVVVYGIEAPLCAPCTEPGQPLRAAIPELLGLLSEDLATLATAGRERP